MAEINQIDNFGKVIGYISAYFLFTTVLFLILEFLNRIPENWDYPYIMLITLIVIIIGVLVKRLLK